MTASQHAVEYSGQISRKRARGWNTWDTRSVLRHVLLPDGLGVSLGFAALDKLVWLGDAFFGRQELPRTAGTQLTSTDKQLPTGNFVAVKPGPHAYDGTYTELEVDLRGARFRVRTASDGDDWLALVEPLQNEPWPRVLTVQVALLWGNGGWAERIDGSCITAHLPRRCVSIHAAGNAWVDPNLPAMSPYLAFRVDQPVVICAGSPVDLAEARAKIQAAAERVLQQDEVYGELSEAHGAMQSCLAWNLIYEPRFQRILCPVARDWNCKRGGYAVFCWDSFLTAWMIAQDDPDLGYACALETFREMVDDNFVANVVQGTGRRALDRSQPPVGSLSLLGMHRQHANLEALAAAWPALLRWNRWWHATRRNAAGSLSLGSHPFSPVIGDPAEFVQPDTAAGAALESGLDNLPIYDRAPFDERTHLMQIEDVGLNSLYVADSEALAEIARLLGHSAEAGELDGRAREYRSALGRLWLEAEGTFRERRLDTGAWCEREAMTSFYPLLAAAPTREQALRLIGHMLNEARYDGEWIVPTVPRSDAAFNEQLYQRGRIWPPMNFLVYLGLRRYGLREVQEKLAGRSLALLLRGWREHRVVAENYSAIDGSGGIGAHTHPLYGWGGLLAFIAMMEKGLAAAPLRPIGTN